MSSTFITSCFPSTLKFTDIQELCLLSAIVLTFQMYRGLYEYYYG